MAFMREVLVLINDTELREVLILANDTEFKRGF